MSLFRSLGSLLTLKGPKQVRVRPSAPALNRFRPVVEGLEERTVPSASKLAAPNLGPALVSHAQLQDPLLQITNITITKLEAISANTLRATFDLTGELLGQAFTLHDLQLPITLTGADATSDGCPILHLSLQIPDLNLLGLHVQLDDCNGGPVTVDVTAIPTGQTGGGLLGDLLCSLTSNNGLIDLTTLTQDQLDALTQVLNGLLDQLLSGAGATAGGMITPLQQGNGNGHRCDILNLEIPEGIHLNLLGLDVQTSGICLDVFAERGGGLLGNLLCSVDHLLDSNGNTGNAINNLVGRILNLLNGLNL